MGTAGAVREVRSVLDRLRIESRLTSSTQTATVAPARAARDVAQCDAVIVGGAFCSMCCQGDARRFVLAHATALRALAPWWAWASGAWRAKTGSP